MSKKMIIGSQYFVFFGTMGIFLPYFNLYCYHLGFSGFQIGTLSAVRSMALILFPLLWGALADRFQRRRAIYIACNSISAVVWACYLFTADFWFMLVITIFYGIFYAPIISFLEAFSMDILGAEKRSYGRVRAWGSISFIVVVVAIGKIIDVYPIRLILVLILAGSMLQVVLSLKTPRIEREGGTHFLQQAGELFNKRVVVFLLCGFLMLVSHGTYYGFFSIHLEKLGYGNSFIGVTWALASIAEIVVMITSKRIFNRFSLRNVLFFSFITATVRWLALFWSESMIFIVITQALHAFSYGTFHMASILYIDLLTPEETKTLGQAVNNAVSYGSGLMVGFLLNGYLYAWAGTRGLFLISAVIALLGGVLINRFAQEENPVAVRREI